MHGIPLNPTSSSVEGMDPGTFSIIDQYIAEQQRLTAVERFSREHETPSFKDSGTYEALIPLDLPGEGQQYAFEVDLDQCSGCKACVAACHSLNGLEPAETWRKVGAVHGGTHQAPWLQTITTACHHCVEPGCLEGCPVKAYEKDPVTGIVRHLDDQCIGCQYCLLKCPYEVPQYSVSKGIVRKCNMCGDRLEAREAPACVQSCPNEAIRIHIVDQREVRSNPQNYVKVADAPDSRFTLPTTLYKTKRQFPENTRAMDHQVVKPEPAHLPLVWMLVLTQLSIGGFWVSRFLPETGLFTQFLHNAAALGLGLLGLGASLLHLGRPQYAFRAFLGWKTSWMSREIIMLGLFAKLAVLYTALQAMNFLPSDLQVTLPVLGSNIFQEALLGVVGVVGMAAIFCSAMIYQSTPRPYWANSTTAMKFYLTALILGASLGLGTYLTGLWLTGSWKVVFHQEWLHLLCFLIMAASFLKLMIELQILNHFLDTLSTPHQKILRLLFNDLKPLALSRLGVGFLGGIILPGWLWAAFSLENLFWMACAAIGILTLTATGELLERTLFFRASIPPKMPGVG